MTYHHNLGISALEVRQRAVEHVDPAVRQMAADFVEQGMTAFNADDFDTAIRRYTDAWTIYPAPDILLVIGLTLLRLGRFRDASFRFQRYLRENPEGSRRDTAQEYLAEAQVAMERGPGTGPDMVFSEADVYGAGQPAVAPPPPAEIPPDVLAAKRASIRSARQVAQQAPPPTSIPNPYSARRATYGVWIATGVGVLGILGLGYWLSRPKKPKANRRRRRRR
jgi:tetratricopeptide (TPR) repeat protein